MAKPRALVANASSEKQVRAAKESDTQRAEREALELAAVLALPAGRSVLWRVLARCGPFKSVWAGTDREMAYNAGQQDLGHWLIDLIGSADPEAYLLMQREAAKLTANIVEPKARTDDPLEDADDGN